MKKNDIPEVFFKLVNKEGTLDSLIKELKKEVLNPCEMYACQAFCCAVLAKNSTNYLNKRKYIKQYDIFISRAFNENPYSIEARLIRFMVEQKLKNVEFVEHILEDLNFLKKQYGLIEDMRLKEVIYKIVLQYEKK